MANMEPDLIDFATCDAKTVTAARDLYNAYIANSRGLSWNGQPCPTWDVLVSKASPVCSHWCAVVLSARALAAGGCL